MGCKICNGKHSSLLHQSVPANGKVDTQNYNNQEQRSSGTIQLMRTNNTDQQNDTLKVQNNPQGQSQIVLSHNVENSENFVLLSTAMVHVYNSKNQPITCRVLLDSGLQSNFITRESLEKLKLSTTKIYLPNVPLADHMFNRYFNWLFSLL